MTYTVEYSTIAKQMDNCLSAPFDKIQHEEEKGMKIFYGKYETTVTFPSEQAYVLFILRWS